MVIRTNSINANTTTPLPINAGGTALTFTTPLVNFNYDNVGNVATGTTQFARTMSIPTNTDGDEYFTLTVTPRSATNYLWIDIIALVSTSVATPCALSMGLFQDATANALVASSVGSAVTGALYTLNINHTMIAGTTSATTFKVRIGANAAGTTTLNGSGGNVLFGGVGYSHIRIVEVVPGV